MHHAAVLPELPPIEDALVGRLVATGVRTRRNAPKQIRYRTPANRARAVCERDTEFVLLHKLTLEELEGCAATTARRRSNRCPRGPCECRSLGVQLRLRQTLVSAEPSRNSSRLSRSQARYRLSSRRD